MARMKIFRKPMNLQRQVIHIAFQKSIVYRISKEAIRIAKDNSMSTKVSIFDIKTAKSNVLPNDWNYPVNIQRIETLINKVTSSKDNSDTS